MESNASIHSCNASGIHGQVHTTPAVTTQVSTGNLLNLDVSNTSDPSPLPNVRSFLLHSTQDVDSQQPNRPLVNIDDSYLHLPIRKSYFAETSSAIYSPGIRQDRNRVTFDLEQKTSFANTHSDYPLGHTHGMTISTPGLSDRYDRRMTISSSDGLLREGKGLGTIHDPINFTSRVTVANVNTVPTQTFTSCSKRRVINTGHVSQTTAPFQPSMTQGYSSVINTTHCRPPLLKG